MPNEQEVGLAERLGKFINSSPTTAMLMFLGIMFIRKDNQYVETVKELTIITKENLTITKESKSSELRLKEKELDYKYKYPKNDTTQ